MNPELTRQISERLSRLHEGDPMTMARPDTELHMTTETDGNTVTLKAGDFPVVEISSLYRGAVPGQMVVLTANSGPKSAFDLAVGDEIHPAMLKADDESAAMAGVMSHAVVTDLGPIHHNTLPDQAVTVTAVHAATASSMADPSPDEVDEEFWKALGMKGPEDMTPDKLTEITKKLKDFQQGLKRMQREAPVTMGIAVRVKHRTSKKRKRKK